MIVADNETAVDLLYYEAIARTVVRLVSEKSDEPLSVGVHGDWGAGKSSVLMMVEGAFEKGGRVLCVRFNGWLFQGFEDAKAVLIDHSQWCRFHFGVVAPSAPGDYASGA